MLKMGKHFLLLLSLLTVTLGLYGQQGNNPFELPNRIAPIEEKIPSPPTQNPFEVNTDSTTKSPAVEANTEPNNPFEINTTSIPPVTTSLPNSKLSLPASPEANDQNPFEISKPTFTNPQKKTVKPTKKTAILTVEPLSGKFKLWMTIFLVTLLTVLVNIYNSVLVKIYRSFLNDNFLKMVHRDYGTVTMIPYLILYAFSLIVTGIFLFVVLNYYEISFFSTAIMDLFACIGGVFAVFITKHLVLQIIGAIFPITKEIEQYSFTIIIFGIIVGLFLLPAILLISYAPPNLTITLIYGTFIAIGLVYLYRILRSLFIGLKYISLHKFHFFVYLCTIEIAPLLVLMKLATAA